MRRKQQIQALQQELALLRQTVDSGKELAALAADGLELGELIETVRHGLHIRRVDETEIRHIPRGARHAHRQHVQDDRAQGRA